MHFKPGYMLATSKERFDGKGNQFGNKVMMGSIWDNSLLR